MLARNSRTVAARLTATRAFARQGQAAMSTAWVSEVPMGPPDPILGLNEAFMADANPDKMSLGVGAYRDGNGKPYVLPSVLAAEDKMKAEGINKEYAGMAGIQPFVDLSLKFALADAGNALADKRVAGVQAMSGTGACSLAGSFFKKFSNATTMYVPTPTWGNHHNIFRDVGLPTTNYAYLNDSATGLDFDAMLASIAEAPAGSVFLLHACAHNPTGIDPTLDQWKQISAAMSAKGHFPFFDCAYQGFASGNADTDAAAIRMFVEDGHRIMLAQSYAKNFGLYGERIGCLSMVCDNADESDKVLSQLKTIIRAAYSNPPIHGAHIVKTILSDPALEKQWYGECKAMADRIIDMRAVLVEGLSKAGSTKDWSHITSQIGMFAYSGLSKEQVDTLRYEYAIYMTGDGRISMAGVNGANVERLSECIHAVTK